MSEINLKIDQIVYIYVDPRYVRFPDQSPVWECSVKGIETISKYDKDGEKKDVFVHLECGLDSKRESIKDIFLNKSDAVKHAAEKVKKLRSLYINKARVSTDTLDILSYGEVVENWMK